MTARSRWVSCAALAVAVAAPGSALAATKSVSMGPPAAVSKMLGMKYGTDVNDFFPHGVTVRAGDSVRFVPAGFHDVNLPKSGGKPLALFVPGTKVTGVNDAAGAPFWFNGAVPALGFNPQLAMPGFGKTFTYTGAKAVLSGLPMSDKTKPMTVKFAKAGTYTYFCDLHPGMTGTVRVVAKGKPVPSAAADAKAVKAQVAAVTASSKSLIKSATTTANSVHVGLHGAHGVEFFGFFPDKLTVAPGTTVTFAMAPGSTETHTATTGPGNPESEPMSYLGAIAASFEGPAPDPRALYPSDPPTAAATLTPTLHGNGFWGSGGLDAIAASPLPRLSTVTVGAPGTYEFYCMIHPFMHLTITAG